MRAAKRCVRSGKILVLSAFLMSGILGMLAFAIDIGYIMVAKSDLQRSADAAAHAAAMRYASKQDYQTIQSDVRVTAREYVNYNKVLKQAADVSLNYFNEDPDGDIVLGKLDFNDPSSGLQFGDASEYNAVRVRVKRTNDQNGSVPLFIARIFGHRSVELEATATAAMIRSVKGFRIAEGEPYSPILPITIEAAYWDSIADGDGDDEWSWNLDGTVTNESDGVPELVLYPDRTTSGNFGTLNIGHSENSTNLLSGQIRNGLSAEDLAQYGGELSLDDYGDLPLGGDPGLSASVKDDLEAINGVPRIIPLYDQVDDPGNNAVYNIVRFVGVRLMYVNLNGNNKQVVIQPADITLRGVIYSESSGVSEAIYSPAVLVK